MKKFMVGGAVRDTLMGLEPHDVDFVVVGSTPEEMLAAGFTQVGADFPVFLDESGTEYALARTERKSGRGYNGFVTDHSASVTLEDDLMRRDLTINAMAMDGDTLVDPFGGQDDLKNRVLRHVSPAFADDPVRVLRLARFHARFGHEWTVHPDTLAFARQMASSGELEHLTRERVLKELEKALSESSPELFFSTLKACGALEVVLPELDLPEHDVSESLLHTSSAKGRYSGLAAMMEDSEAFEERLNVSTEWRKFAAMYKKFLSLSAMDHPVDNLYKLDAYRQAELFFELRDKAPWHKSHHVDTMLGMNFAFHKTHELGFFDLSEEQKNSLRGPAVGQAIKEMRRDAFENLR